MVVVIRADAPRQEVEKIKERLETADCKVSLMEGKDYCVLGVIGDTSGIDVNEVAANEYVEKVMRVQQSYKLASRMFHMNDTVIRVRDKVIGGQELAVIAGPCSVENEAQILELAKKVKECGAGFLRGGAFKARTSPYSFQGMKLEGLELLKHAREETGLPIVTEIMSTDMIEKFEEDVDIIQVGARNMQNFELLKELGKVTKPILLKRGLSATIEELLMSAEYIMSEGNSNVILCERGIRTFETYTRNTLDLSAVLAIKKLSHLPVIVDPSHASGLWWMVEPLAMASVAVGADGIMVEVHNDPENAKCDGQQSIKPERFKTLMEDVTAMARSLRRIM
ncbi:MAG TPA: 3-deoxy-7-phosphoheptulonate synthase [Bacillota bacterium]|nr:3-deoxy-7-phosphoheptulonate synthase [Bacillota bacterium]HOR86030.1 3-deoxy-7-phosphoheptulonate synthase [Bacillota bacterium]HPL52912.1 3-deoxy-7-phosphoheptulonate synthase [Bacillota bacterium]